MKRKHSILVIEDDPAIRSGIVDLLELEGYHVFQESQGDEALTSALRVTCDLILLDLILPKIGGLEILEELRKSRPSLPVIILTAKGEEQDRVCGLKLGADDYVVKPFSGQELLARIEAVLRRSAERPVNIETLSFPTGEVSFDRQDIIYEDGSRDVMTEKERDLLHYLATCRGRTVSREELLQKVWKVNPRAIVQTRTVDMTIKRLREKLRDHPNDPKIILTVRGKGYLFAAHIDSSEESRA